MGHGDTSSGGYDDSGKAVAASFLEADGGVGMGMTMQNTISSYPYDNRMTSFIPYYQNDQHHSHFGGGAVFGNQMSIPTTGSDSGKVIFTAAQWQELERQTMIYKYIMASIPVPANLLSTQSNKGVMDLRFSSGSDPEPWRCRRTDGKKWRCSRDIIPDQKYCERHSHKSRPRSRKPVEIQSHNTNITTTSALNVTPSAPTSYQNSRCTEWFLKSATMPVSTSNQQLQQSMNSPRVGSKRTHIFPNEFEGNHPLDTTSSSFVDASIGARRQNFIDAWSRSGAGDNCSLTLSMQCSGGIDDDNDQSLEIGNADVLKSHNQWLNQASWMSSPPGGPLGEALGLGIASTTKGPMSLPSPHGHSKSTATSTSCEKSGSHDQELSFRR
ncbi:WRC domain, Glutamine-Leucine-Glutamine, QLQ, Growth-regulating factor [Artemisia annua]|uniref:Growth-regulating factor n=1 Tax=Artemisia annua TaxID=35608 RepID=A0A2U1Q7Q4_ARTAN|nr:WRC domain, Glutamine-Leucine-Glutamine, QLQ, Growth-regulating factor [Artemisia annua]